MYEVDKYTVSLLHFDDGIKDETGKVWTAIGSPIVSATQSKFGGKSLCLNGSTDYLTTPNSSDFDFGTGDFTIEWWEYRTSNKGTVFFRNTQTQVSKAESAPFVTGYCDGANIVSGCSDSLTAWTGGLTRISMGSVKLNSWTHYALVRKNGTFYTFQNGILINEVTATVNIPISLAEPTIGAFRYSGGIDQGFSGYIDELRISNIARWTETFPPEPLNTTNLLRVTMLDSSERDYQLATTEIDGFVNWFNSHTSTNTTSYMLNKKVGTQNSKEYLSFDKIISFEVMELK